MTLPLVVAGSTALAFLMALTLGPSILERHSARLVAIAVLAFVLEVDAEPLFGSTIDRGRDMAAAVLLVVLAGWALIRHRSVRHRVLSSPIVWLGALFLLGALTAPWSVDPLSSGAKSVVALAMVVFALGVVDREGYDDAFWAVLVGLAALVVGSVAWEMVGPGSESLLAEGQSLDSGLFGLVRHGGLAGDSNHLGRVAAVCLGGGALLWSSRSRWASLSMHLIGLVGLGFAQSRTALVAGLLAGAYLHLRRGRTAAAVAAMWLLIVVVLGAWAAGSLEVESVTRNGSTQELTTLTGRTALWSVTLEVGAERPLLGHGAFAADTVLDGPVEDGRVAFDAADAHNMLLNTYLTQGLVGVALLLITAGAVVRRRRMGEAGPRAMLFLVLLAALSVTENLIRSPNGVLLAFAVQLAALTPQGVAESDVEAQSARDDPADDGPVAVGHG